MTFARSCGRAGPSRATGAPHDGYPEPARNIVSARHPISSTPQARKPFCFRETAWPLNPGVLGKRTLRERKKGSFNRSPTVRPCAGGPFEQASGGTLVPRRKWASSGPRPKNLQVNCSACFRKRRFRAVGRLAATRGNRQSTSAIRRGQRTRTSLPLDFAGGGIVPRDLTTGASKWLNIPIPACVVNDREDIPAAGGPLSRKKAPTKGKRHPAQDVFHRSAEPSFRLTSGPATSAIAERVERCPCARARRRGSPLRICPLWEIRGDVESAVQERRGSVRWQLDFADTLERSKRAYPAARSSRRADSYRPKPRNLTAYPRALMQFIS